MTSLQFIKTSIWYGEVIALNEVSFNIKNNSGITGLVGSNGAGKTSALKLCASLIKPTLGEVLADGEPVWNNLPYLEKVGYSPEVDRLFNWMTGREFLEWMARFNKIPTEQANKRVLEILDLVGMKHASDRRIIGYSRGMRQRIKVGQALLNEPEILLLDEPMSGTDPIGRNILNNVLINLVKDKKINILVSSHVLHELERISDQVLMLKSGKLVAEGKINEVRNALSQIPHKIRITTNNARKLASLLTDEIIGLTIESEHSLMVELTNRENINNTLLNISKNAGIQINEIYPLDDDLTSVFNILRK